MDLCYMALEQLEDCHWRGSIPYERTHHASDDSVKAHAHGDYDDHGSWTGSMVMLMMLFPRDHGLTAHASGFSLMPCLNGAADRDVVLHLQGKTHQRSGTGQNNCRTNLLEAIIGSQGEQVTRLQQLWGHVDLCMGALHSDLGDGIWCADQDELISRMLGDTSEALTSTNCLICQLSSEMNLDMCTYYLYLKRLIAHMAVGSSVASYQEMQTTTQCTQKKARRLWHCMTVIEQALREL